MGVTSLVWFPAFLGYLNAFVASCKVMGWTRLADELGKIEDAITVFVATVKKQNQPPTGGNTVKLPILLISFLILGGVAFADVSVQSALQSVNVPTTIDELQSKAVNAGYFWNWKDSKVQPTFTYDFGGAKAFSWGTFDYLDIGYASPDVLVAGPSLTLNIAVIEKKWGITAPSYIQNVINSMSLGLTPMLGLEQIGGRNRFTGGPGGFLKVKW